MTIPAGSYSGRAVVLSSPLAGFFALAYVWTWLCWGAVLADAVGRVSLPVPAAWLATAGQFGPFAAALAVSWVVDGRAGVWTLLGRLVRWRVGPGWLAVSLLLLPATMWTAILLHTAVFGGADPLAVRDSWDTLPAHFALALVLGGPLGEEPGWRGFALPWLQERYGPVAASVGLGLLWAGWHLPLWWMYPAPCPFALYAAGAVSLTMLFTWLFNHTRGSVLVSLLFHTSMTVASVRLPEAPAYPAWVLLLTAGAAVVLLADRRLGWRPPAG